jgi:hypothetical protein
VAWNLVNASMALRRTSTLVAGFAFDFQRAWSKLASM